MTAQINMAELIRAHPCEVLMNLLDYHIIVIEEELHSSDKVGAHLLYYNGRGILFYISCLSV